MNSGGFNWQSLGKADYSQASALVSSLPEENRKCLEGVSRELLVRILHLSWVFSERSGRGAAYCWPTLKTLAGYLARSERTVERHLSKLQDAGLISYRRRTTAGGSWTSNLYQMGKTFLASLIARGKKKVQSFRVPTFLATNDLKREYKLPPSTGRQADNPPTDEKQRPVSDTPTPYHQKYTPPSWMTDRIEPKTSLVASSWDDASGEWDMEDKTAERKAELKRQAESLRKRGL